MKHVALIFALTACSGSVAETGDDSEPYTGETIGWDVLVDDGTGFMADVEVCTLAGCATSGVDGTLHLDLPVGESVVTATHPDIMPKLMALTIDDAPPNEDIFVFPQATLEALFGTTVTFDWTKALLIGTIIGSEGATVALDPAGGSAVYLTGLTIDSTLTGAGSEFGDFALFNLEQTGDVRANFEGTTGTCASTIWSHQGASSTQTSVELRAGYMSTTEIRCTT